VAQRLPQVRVIAIEAQRRLAGILAANALNNQLFNIDVMHAAAGARAGLEAFPQAPLDARFNFGTVGAAMTELPAEMVRVCTLDEVAPADTRFVKIDVPASLADRDGFQGERHQRPVDHEDDDGGELSPVLAVFTFCHAVELQGGSG